MHKVKQGECISSIAFKGGLLPDDLWNHPENAELKKQRKDPNVLATGDLVFVPEKEPAERSVGAGQRHRFRRKAVPEMLRIVLEDSRGEPRADVAYSVDVDGTVVEGITATDGLVEVAIQPDAVECNLYIEPEEEPVAEGVGQFALLRDDGSGYDFFDASSVEDDAAAEDDEAPMTEHYVFKLGELDPLESEDGIKQRLVNLGYDMSDLGQAVGKFQQDAGLNPSGQSDAQTRRRLGDSHDDVA
ncbi:MAG: peptidoglycan-binding domain-containing protein [Pseudomonadota bacterium]